MYNLPLFISAARFGIQDYSTEDLKWLGTGWGVWPLSYLPIPSLFSLKTQTQIGS